MVLQNIRADILQEFTVQMSASIRSQQTIPVRKEKTLTILKMSLLHISVWYMIILHSMTEVMKRISQYSVL